MNGVGFEEAKIKVAEMIGRPDLICGRSAQTYSRADAASLLHPAPENKDDDLGWQYLAHRLGLEPNMVPRPLTKVVGIRQLAYFDAPRQKGEKPLHVGDFPAAVFETIDRNDGRHAHRIYLAFAGLGKAELGHSADGTRRDPKKSARKIGNEKTTGRSVIWGDPSKAETAIICEGIETAAAVAFAVNTEITSGTVMVAACITATGIEAFQPWPAVKRVIVGADRDEFSGQGDAPSRRGVIAAQKFAQLHHTEISISIALPGRPGEKIDWLDLLRREGVEAVRRGIYEAVSFEAHSQDNSPESKEDRRAGEGAKQADVIIRLARERAQLFHTPEGTSFADVRVEGHRETWPVRSQSFKLWLIREYYTDCKCTPNSEAIQAALNLLDAVSRFDGPELTVCVRVAGLKDKIYIDLGTRDWSAVEVDSNGWRIVAEPPVRFRRSKGLIGLPIPERGGGINALRPFLNVKTDADFSLAVSWLVAALRNRGPYPVLVLTGEHGTAKTTFSRVCRGLIDPNSSSLRALPRNDRDLFIAANNGYVMAFDNVSNLPPWLSDSLARLATGASFGTRELYTNSEESLFDAVRPIILNGIEDFVTRGDLADRAVGLTLMVIPEDQRWDEETFWAEFNRAAPQILGALLDAVACGLKRLPDVKLDRKPRMADFAKWVVACESALPWRPGLFLGAYENIRVDAVETLLESDAVAIAVRKLIARQPDWKGTATELLGELNATAADELRKSDNWPKTSRGMSGALRRIAPGLRKLSYTLEFGERESNSQRNRIIHLAAPVERGAEPSEPSKPSECQGNRSFAADGRNGLPEASPDGQSAWNSTKRTAMDGVDGVDGQVRAAADSIRLAEVEI
jgi:hypothetical protein